MWKPYALNFLGFLNLGLPLLVRIEENSRVHVSAISCTSLRYHNCFWRSSVHFNIGGVGSLSPSLSLSVCPCLWIVAKFKRARTGDTQTCQSTYERERETYVLHIIPCTLHAHLMWMDVLKLIDALKGWLHTTWYWIHSRYMVNMCTHKHM